MTSGLKPSSFMLLSVSNSDGQNFKKIQQMYIVQSTNPN